MNLAPLALACLAAAPVRGPVQSVPEPDRVRSPQQRPASDLGLKRALRALDRSLPEEGWTRQPFTILPDQLRAALGALPEEVVERVLAQLVQNRGLRLEGEEGFVTAVLYEFDGSEGAAFLVDRILEVTRLQKAGETYAGTRILSAEFEELEAGPVQGVIARRRLAFMTSPLDLTGKEIGVVLILAHSGPLAVELALIEVERIDAAQAVTLAAELLERAAEAPPPDGSFDREREGSVPAGWQALETRGAGSPASWAIAADAGAPSPGQLLRVVAAGSGQTFNLLLTERAFAADVQLSVKLRAEAGVEDQGGGLVWRARDADNYYVTRWNPLEDNLRLYKVVAGVRSQLASAATALDPDRWHELRAVAAGRRLTVFLDGEQLLQHEDGTFADGGRVGLWTKADASCTFDDFEVSW